MLRADLQTAVIRARTTGDQDFILWDKKLLEKHVDPGFRMAYLNLCREAFVQIGDALDVYEQRKRKEGVVQPETSGVASCSAGPEGIRKSSTHCILVCD
jgi:hypothetical protein